MLVRGIATFPQLGKAVTHAVDGGTIADVVCCRHGRKRWSRYAVVDDWRAYALPERGDLLEVTVYAGSSGA